MANVSYSYSGSSPSERLHGDRRWGENSVQGELIKQNKDVKHAKDARA
jgi:hypothetical protein